MVSTAAYIQKLNETQKSYNGRVCENGGPISDRGASLLRIGNIVK
jgi:hypothetical protein